MLPAIVIFVFLFNLTSTSTQEISETQKFHDSLQLKSKETPKSKNINTSSLDFSTNKISGKQDSNVVVIPLGNDPFSGKDQNRDRRQQVTKQDPQKPNNEKAHNEMPSSSKQEETNNTNKKKILAPSSNSNSPLKQTVKSNVTTNETKSIDGSSTIPIRITKEDILQSGALLRGFYVFIGFSVLIMVYMFFRSHRLRRGSQPSTTVRKYGVTARRTDMEMRPLELEDDEDDTLFEVGNPRGNR